MKLPSPTRPVASSFLWLRRPLAGVRWPLSICCGMSDQWPPRTLQARWCEHLCTLCPDSEARRSCWWLLG